MIMKKNIFYTLFLFLIALSSCNEDEETFDNKVFIDSSSKVGELLLKGGTNELKSSFHVAIPKAQSDEVTVSCAAAPSLISKYNESYYDEALVLPAEFYEVVGGDVSITAGAVRSKEIEISFKDLENLDTELVYVLPVTISQSNISILESARNLYFVIKGAASINIVGDIDENFLKINWANPDVCNNLTQVTMEALIRVRNFDKMISTVMGIEGKFLIRIGDAGFPSNQIQIATGMGNFPPKDPNKGLPTNEWVHVAFTYDSADGSMIIYVDGKKQSVGTFKVGKVDLGQPGYAGFLIGRSYDNDRGLAGEISEARIWNKVRTQEEIQANFYGVDPTSPGLVAYWKFNDESSTVVKDHTANGNDAEAIKPLRWTSVTLPEPKGK